jgi:hypothetical protein
MIRYLAIPDLSATPARMPILREIVFPAILRSAREHSIDFALFPGDVFDVNYYLGNDLNSLQDFFAELMNACPVAGVCGTPGHETPAMYGALERIGFVLMRPGRVYALDGFNHQIIEIKNLAIRQQTLGCILFGIPELIPSRIQQELGYPTHADYLREYVAPMRMQFESIPAILAIHGTISDYSQENELDPTKRSASAFVRTDDIAETGVTRTEAGHIHTPWESSKICAGYAGSWGEDYGCLGFVPAMNLIELQENGTPFPESGKDNSGVSITRIGYGTPARMKIDKPLPVYSPDIAYWLHTTDPTIETIGGHPWSRITHEPQRIESRRITHEQAAGATLADLYKLNDPTIDAVTLSLLRDLDKSESAISKPARKVSVNAIEVEGCTFFKGALRLTLDQLTDRLNLLIGQNGDGKSAALSFFSPYPDTIGKLPKCGRPSAIWEWFDGAGRISKYVSLNDEQHLHEIIIKGKKVTCSLVVNGVEQLDKGTFDEMKTRCEQLYGSFVDYLLTSFYVQPQQGYRVDGAIAEGGLVNASRSDMQRLVQAIAGIDHEQAHREALDQQAATEKTLADKESWLKGAAEFAVDVPNLVRGLADYNSLIRLRECEIKSTLFYGKNKKTEYETLIEKQKANEKEKERKESDQKIYITQKGKKIAEIKAIRSLETVASQLPTNQATLDSDDALIARMNARQEIENRNATTRNEYTRLSTDYNSRLALLQVKTKTANNTADNEYNTALSCYQSNKAKHEATIGHAGMVCEHCGKIPFALMAKQVEHAQAELKTLIEPIKPTATPIPESIPGEPLPIAPTYKPVPAVEPSTINRAALLAEIQAGQSARATIDAKQEQLAGIQTELDALAAITYTISDTIDAEVSTSAAQLESLRTQHATLKTELATLNAQADALRDQIERATEHAAQIESTRAQVVTLTDTLGRWKYIASRMKRVAAMELELVIEDIDREATAILSPYRDGRYTFQTRTQRMGTEDVVDEFDIMIHDNETGIERSFASHSVGEKAFLSDPYTKALIKIRNQRSHITYSPIISDEADSAIDIPSIPVYYAIQDAYYQDERVIVISHTPDARNYIGNQIAVKELLK